MVRYPLCKVHIHDGAIAEDWVAPSLSQLGNGVAIDCMHLYLTVIGVQPKSDKKISLALSNSQPGIWLYREDESIS